MITMKERTKYRIMQDLSCGKNRIKFKLCRFIYTTQDKMIMFESYHGKRYADSVRAIYEYMVNDDYYRDYIFIWAFVEPEDYKFLADNPHTILVKKGSFDYFKYYSAARFWINNVSIPDFLIPSKDQIYIETWHGTPLKKLGCDIENDEDPRQSRERMHKRYKIKGKRITYLITPSDYFMEKMKSAFAIPDKDSHKFFECGYPRNDQLFHYTDEQILDIKKSFGITEEQKVILYTPTWRDNDFNPKEGFQYNKNVDLKAIADYLPDNYVMLFRAHHQIGTKQIIKDHAKIIDVTYVDNINDLFIISDLMITDYSSTMFDYSILKRPMIFHMYDLEEYMNNIRGFYFDISELPGPITRTEKELSDAIINEIEHFNYDNNSAYKAFCEKFNSNDNGFASKTLADNIINIPPHKKHPLELLVLTSKKMFNRAKIVSSIINYNLEGILSKHGLLVNNNTRRLIAMKDIHKGERCFLIGNGPSLSPDDLNMLKDEYTFGTNMVYKIFDRTSWRPSYHCVSDNIYARKLRDELYNNVKSPLFTVEETYRKMTKRTLDTTYVHTIPSERYKVKGNLYSYCMVKATVLSLAFEFAFHMGFKEIYLLGVDCTNPHAANGHFSENYTTRDIALTDISRIKERMNKENVTTEQIGAHIIDRSLEVYQLIKEYADKHGIKVYNATRGGNLEIFPRVKLEDVLANKTEEQERRK